MNSHWLDTVLKLLTKFPSTLQFVSCCFFLFHFKLDVQADSWLYSLWVAAIFDPHSNPLTKCTAGFSGCELLPSLGFVLLHWLSLPVVLQKVSHYLSWACFKCPNQDHSWHCSLWVAAISGTVSSLLTKPILGSAGCELLFPGIISSSLIKLTPGCTGCESLLSLFTSYLSSLISKLTLGSADCELLPFKRLIQAINQAHPWLCRWWVATVFVTILTYWPRLFLAVQGVSHWCSCFSVKLAD